MLCCTLTMALALPAAAAKNEGKPPLAYTISGNGTASNPFMINLMDASLVYFIAPDGNWPKKGDLYFITNIPETLTEQGLESLTFGSGELLLQQNHIYGRFTADDNESKNYPSENNVTFRLPNQCVGMKEGSGYFLTLSCTIINFSDILSASKHTPLHPGNYKFHVVRPAEQELYAPIVITLSPFKKANNFNEK